MLVDLWLLLRWNLNPVPLKVLLSQVATLVMSTTYWLAVAALLTFIVKHL